METLSTFLKLTTEDHLRRLNSGLRGGGRSLELDISFQEDDRNHYLTLQAKEEKATLVIPRPRLNEFENLVIGGRNDRAVCPFMIVLDGKPQHVSYDEFVLILLTRNIEEIFPLQGKRNFLDKILFGFNAGRGKLAVTLCQRFLNLTLFNALPLSGTPMQDWAMNHRLMIFDPVFDTLRPEERLAYQRRKNELLHPWGSIGLSDGAAAMKNYILQVQLRDYTAFGRRHHNPMRNPYSTLGMKGPEAPWVVSASAAALEARGITRGGWNWMTVFLDLPDNFEDQILVSNRHAGKTVTYERTFTVFGEETVLVGDNVLKGRILGVNQDESPVMFEVDCDHAEVLRCEDGIVPFDGKDQPVRTVTLRVVYSFKEGFKITNQDGNKGVVSLRELGTVEVRGKQVPIDVIVSARSVQKRKNFGQVLTALTTLIRPERTVVPDDVTVQVADIERALVEKGFPKSGTCAVSTPWGKFDTICGWVHWGVTKTPEEQLWAGRDTWVESQRGLRRRGNKFSPIELKALTTLLGPGSAVVGEILSYQQGVEEVKELLRVLECMRGNYRESTPTVLPGAFVYSPAGTGTFHEEAQLVGTVADEEMYPKGCYIQLPFTICVQIPLERWKGEIVEGISGRDAYEGVGTRVLKTDRVMVPPIVLRKPWKHPTGMFGLTDIATSLNQILEAIDRLKFGEIKEEQVSTLVFRYFHMIGRTLSLKTGHISQYLMAVRYPWSSKATATLGSGLKPNWIEIHQDMARDLNVEDGDYVLVERFPCLGFMSTRIQRVKVTNDPECKFVIRVSGNSLVSMNLDFDGDVIYVMSFHSDAAKRELEENFHNPHPRIKKVLDEMNARKVPTTASVTLQELGLRSFADMTPEQHADVNATSLAVKIWTGPVIALCYDLMRIVEGNVSYEDRDGHINIERFLDMVGNSVFAQKHGSKSLREECTEAVCLADAEALISLGFPRRETDQLCGIIRVYAAKLGVRTPEDLEEHYRVHVEEGKSNIIKLIVRRFHKTYFATRSILHPIDLLEHLEVPPRDLVSHLVRMSLQKGSVAISKEAAA